MPTANSPTGSAPPPINEIITYKRAAHPATMNWNQNLKRLAQPPVRTTLLKKPKTLRPLAFSRFPPEIRENIFNRCIHIDMSKYNPRFSPNLIIALRSDKRSYYQEALRAFYRLNTFVVRSGTLHTWQRLGGRVRILQMMRKIDVISLNPQVKYRVLDKIFKHAYRNNVQEISMTVHYPGELAKRMETVYEGFPNVKRVSISFGGPDLQGAWRREIELIILILDIKFGVRAKMTTKVEDVIQRWVWEDEKGRPIMQCWNETGKKMALMAAEKLALKEMRSRV